MFILRKKTGGPAGQDAPMVIKFSKEDRMAGQARGRRFPGFGGPRLGIGGENGGGRRADDKKITKMQNDV